MNPKIGFLIVLAVILDCEALSDRRLCGDPNCEVPISEGRTVLKYFSNQDGMLSFKNNQPVTIFSKGAGQNPDLWGVEIQGKRGYANKAHIIEEKVLIRELGHEVPVNDADPTPPTEAPPIVEDATSSLPEDATPSLPIVEEALATAAAAEVVADPNVEVIDGTTFRLNEPSSEIQPTMTQQQQQVTASVEIESSLLPSDTPAAKAADTPEMTQPIEQSVKTTPPVQEQQKDVPQAPKEEVTSEAPKVPAEEAIDDKKIDLTSQPDPQLSTQPTPITEAVPSASKVESVASDIGAHQAPAGPSASKVEPVASDIGAHQAPAGEASAPEVLGSVENIPLAQPSVVPDVVTPSQASTEMPKVPASEPGNDVPQQVVQGQVPPPPVVDVPVPNIEPNQLPPTLPPLVDDTLSGDAEDTNSNEQVAEEPEQEDEVVDDDDDQDDKVQEADNGALEADDDLDAKEPGDLDYEDEDDELEGALEREEIKRLVEEELELHKEDEPANKEDIKKTVEEQLEIHSKESKEEALEASAHEEILEGAGAENGEAAEKLEAASIDQEPLPQNEDLKEPPMAEDPSVLAEPAAPEPAAPEPTISTDEQDVSSEADSNTLDAESPDQALVEEVTDEPANTESPPEEPASADGGGGVFSGWFGSHEHTTQPPSEATPEPMVDHQTDIPSEDPYQASGTEAPHAFTDLPPPSNDEIKFYMPEDFAPSEHQAVSPPPEVSAEPADSSVDASAYENSNENIGATTFSSEAPTDQTDQVVTTETPDVPEPPQETEQSEEIPDSVPESDPNVPEPENVPEDVEMKEEREAPRSDVADTIEHYVESAGGFLPDWLHHALHGDQMNANVSPGLLWALIVTAFTLILAYLVTLIMDKLAREGPLKGKVSTLDSELFKAKNEILLLRKELEESGKSSTATVVQKTEPPAHLLEELERLKEEKEKLLTDLYQHQSELQIASDAVKKMNSEYDELQAQHDQTLQELADAESIVQDCLEEKRNRKQVDNTDMIRAIDTLRDQLNSQKESVQKYEAKIKKRDSELKEKIQDLRKQRAEAANAKLQVEKLTNQHESLKKKVAEMESNEEELEKEIAASKQQISELEAVKQKFYDAKEEIESKDSELEAKTTEIAVLKETIQTLETLTAAKSEDDADGWDVGDAVPDLATIQEMSQLKVDLQKAQAACEKLNDDLTTAESSRDEFESRLKEIEDELQMARRIREQAVTEKEELHQKHQVLTSYFNQRESELLKQLGLQSSRLGDAEQGAESTAKQLTSLCEELESYKAQVKSLKLEMEEQERSLKAQNATLEKKQHESWVTARQETRRLTEAQTEMQTLRNRLTIAESKLVEKEVEVRQLHEENNTLKESINTISQNKPDPFYTNGNGLHNLSLDSAPTGGPLATSSGLLTSGPSSLDEPPPPELPMLPILPPMMAQPPMIPPDSRPPPLGRRSPPPGRGRGYSRSPSPPSGGEYYGRRYRDVSPARSDRSRTSRSGRYDSYDSRYDRYSPSPPYRRDRSRERSPDRYSSRSDRSDRHYRDYRDTPSRDLPVDGRRRSSRDGDFPGSGLDNNDYHHRRRRDGGRGDSLKEPKHHGPKTSSPMVDQDGYNI